jgi:hypothetical protein
MNWKLTSEELPPLDEIVWLYDAANEVGPWIGCRADDADGWLWANAYGSMWWNGQKWDADAETDDDYHPTHWMPMPYPPNVAGEPPAHNQGEPNAK